MAAGHPFKKPRWRSVFVAFVVVVVLLASTSSAVFYATRKVQKQGEVLMQNAIVSVELADRMGADIVRRRLLLGEHIHETQPEGMARTEKQIADVDADYRAAANRYEKFVAFPGEAELWRSLQTDVVSLDEPTAAVLALSRQNRDSEAREALRNIDNRFLVVDRKVAALVRINRQGAEQAMAHAEALRRWSSILSTAFLLGQVSLTLVVGIWTTRVVRRGEDESRRYAEMLEWRNRELDAFAGRVAHDLGGPLTTISLAATNLGRRMREEDKTVGILQRGVGRMQAIIQDLLALSRIGASACDEVCNPALIAAQIRDEVADRLGAETVALSVAVEPASVRCVAGLLRQVLVNLVDNAAKYRRADVTGEVKLAGGLQGDWYVLEVSDNGVGMSPDEARHAFDPFFRAQRVRERKGTGLGLSIVKRVVDASAGTITIDSQVGQGTTVRVALLAVTPAARATPEASQG